MAIASKASVIRPLRLKTGVKRVCGPFKCLSDMLELINKLYTAN